LYLCNLSSSRDVTEDAFAENKNVASKIAAIMSENKFKFNASEQLMGTNISEVLEAARLSAARVEPAWKGKVIEILKADVFQRTSEDPEHNLQHALTMAADLAQQERESRLPKQQILIDTFCKRVREKLQIGEAIDSLTFDQMEIYVPDKPVRSFGRNRISDTAKKLFAQDTQTKLGADEKTTAAGDFQMFRPQRAASTLLNLKKRPARDAIVHSQKADSSKSFQRHNHSLSVTKILVDSGQANFMQTKLGLPLARVSTPVLKPINTPCKDYDGLQSFESFGETRHTNLHTDARVVFNNRLSPEIQHRLSPEIQHSHHSSRQSHNQIAPRSTHESRHDEERVAKNDAELCSRKHILFDYLSEVTQNSPDLRKVDSISGAPFSKFKSSTNLGQHGFNKDLSSKISGATERELHLSGQVMTTYSVTELGHIHRSQILQARDSVRSLQYRPIVVRIQAPHERVPSPVKQNCQSFVALQHPFTLRETPNFGTELQLTQDMTWVPSSLQPAPKSPIVVGKGPSKPKSRGYSSYDTQESFEILTLPPLNVVLNQNSPTSSKPQTPQQIKPWTPPHESRPLSRNTTSRVAARGNEFQRHITGIAIDDDSFNELKTSLL